METYGLWEENGDDTVDNKDKDKDNPGGVAAPMMILLFRTRSILTAAAPMIILVPVISTLPTNWLLQIPKRRVSLLL